MCSRNNSVIKIQSCWKSSRCRKKIVLFSQLPEDVWKHILYFLSMEHFMCLKIDRLIFLRVTKLYWIPISFHKKKKFNTLFLIRKYVDCLTLFTKQKCIIFCARLINYFTLKNENFLINATIERLVEYN